MIHHHVHADLARERHGPSLAEVGAARRGHHDHGAALGAVSAPHGHGVGVARFVPVADEPGAAGIAVVGVDEWQCRGLGGVLLSRLAQRAQDEGLNRLVAHTSPDNRATNTLLQRMGDRSD